VQVRANDVLAGKYRVTRMLGEGGMGIVLEAVHLGLGHRVALKLLKNELVRPEHRERFFREARAAGSLSSEHVVSIKDIDTLPDGTPFLVMEYLDGSDLGGLVQHRGALPPEEATDYVLQACHALAEAHTRGIVHRDLKPANLFLTRRADGTPLVKVLDFGIAKVAEPQMARDLTATSAYMGSPCYMSPEQVRSAKRVDARTDLWALGVILYELLVGVPPFDGETAGDVFVKISTEPPRAFTPPMPMPGLEAVILRCLRKDPDQRYADIAELAEALAPFAGRLGRARAEAVARIIGRELVPMMPTMQMVPMMQAAPPGPMGMQVAPSGPMVASGMPAGTAVPTLTTLGLGAGQSQAMSSRPRRGFVIAAVAVVILGGVATWGYMARGSNNDGVSPVVVPAASAAIPAPALAPLPSVAGPTPTQPASSAVTPTVPPPLTPAPSPSPVDITPTPPAAAIPTTTSPAVAPPVDAATAAATRETSPDAARKLRKPGRRPGAKDSKADDKSDAKDDDFVEDRR
jgi:eukaryotic-like serine/threonine-protein kinase